MILKVLFRQHDYPLNVISGNQGSVNIIGNGTKFTEIPVHSALETDAGFIGIVSSVQDNTHLTLDRPLVQALNNAIYWVDWSNWRISTSPISRQIESENEGEAGAIVFDNVNMEFYYGESLIINGETVHNPVYKAFDGDIDIKKRFLIRLQACKYDFFYDSVPIITGAYQRLIDNLNNYLSANFRAPQATTIFEGVVDFSSVSMPAYHDNDGEFILSVSFDVLDKLSALSILQSTSCRNETSLWDRINDILYNEPYVVSFALEYTYPDGESGIRNNMTVILHPEVEDPQTHERVYDTHYLTQRLLLPGETVTIFLGESKEKTIIIKKSVLVNGKNYVEFFDNVDITKDTLGYLWQYGPAEIPLYSKTMYGVDINNFTGSAPNEVLQSFNAVKIVQAIVSQQWAGIELVNHLGDDNFPMPLEYYTQLLNEYPFEKELIEALVFLVNTMNCYVFIDRQDRLVLYPKQALDTSDPAADKEIPVEYLSVLEKKIFWDKLVDSVTVTANCWIKDQQQALYVGEGLAQKRPGMKPRNELKKEIFIDSASLAAFGITINANKTLSDPAVPSGDQQKILDRYAFLKASADLDFYGKRHVSYSGETVDISWDMLFWDMMDTFSFIQQKEFTGDPNNGRYFMPRLGIDIDNNLIELEIVSISRKIYDERNIFIGINNYA